MRPHFEAELLLLRDERGRGAQVMNTRLNSTRVPEPLAPPHSISTSQPPLLRLPSLLGLLPAQAL